MHWNPLVIAGIITVILISACGGKKDVPCTEEYRMVTVTVRNKAAQPVVLSSYFVRDSSTGKVIDFPAEDPYHDSINREQGIYILFTDGKMAMTSRSGTGFEFHGYLGGKEIVSERYVIANDRCHIFVKSGNTNIVIDQ